jgi:hypothetical protein
VNSRTPSTIPIRTLPRRTAGARTGLGINSGDSEKRDRDELAGGTGKKNAVDALHDRIPVVLTVSPSLFAIRFATTRIPECPRGESDQTSAD